MNLIHELSRDVDLMGCRLKTGTAVVAQISSVLYDDKVMQLSNYKYNIYKLGVS